MEQIIAQMLPGLLSSLVTACAGALAGYLAGRRKEPRQRTGTSKSLSKPFCAAKSWIWACTT